MSRWWTWPALADLSRFWCINCHSGGLDPPWRTSLGDFWANVQGILRFVWPGGQKDTFRKRCPFGAGAANNLRLPNNFQFWANFMHFSFFWPGGKSPFGAAAT